MSVDPTDPESIEDVYEDEPEGSDDPETPEADAAEQRAELLRQRDTPLTGRDSGASTADALEQSRVVEENEDDYR